MKKLLAALVLAVLSISAVSALEYPAWWEKMGASETYTQASYDVINAYADADSNTLQTHSATTNLNVVSGANSVSMVNGISTKLSGDQQAAVYRQLLAQSGGATVATGTPLKYDPENPACEVTKVVTFEQNQLALFSGDLDCPIKVFGANFDNDIKVGTTGFYLNEETYPEGGDWAQVKGYGDVSIIEAYAGQSSSGSLVEVQTTDPGVGVVSKTLMSGEAGLYAGFDNAVMEPDSLWDPASITIQMGNGNYIIPGGEQFGGDRFFWTTS